MRVKFAIKLAFFGQRKVTEEIKNAWRNKQASNIIRITRSESWTLSNECFRNLVPEENTNEIEI